MHPALAAWCGDTNVAADALDDAFVRALERWSRVARMASAEGWVWRTATNGVRRRQRRSSREREAVRRRDADPSLDGDRPDAFDPDLVRALQALTGRQRTAVVLRYVADLPEREVATLMGIAPGTVAATVHQARQRLVSQLGEAEPPTRLGPGSKERSHG